MIGITSDTDFESELSRLKIPPTSNNGNNIPSNSIRSDSNDISNSYNENDVKVIDIERGRTKGRTEIPHEVRALIASEALSGASPDVLAESFNVSKSSISAYKNDATSTTSYHKPDESLARANSQVRDRIIGPAQSRLIAAIESITPEKLESAKVNVASQVAVNMSAIIKNLEPDAGVTVNNNRVIVYKPRMREEDEFETIVVNE